MKEKIKNKKNKIISISLLLVLTLIFGISVCNKNTPKNNIGNINSQMSENNIEKTDNPSNKIDEIDKLTTESANNIIVKSDNNEFETYGGEVEEISNGIYTVTYDNKESAQNALEKISAEENIVVSSDDIIEMQEIINNKESNYMEIPLDGNGHLLSNNDESHSELSEYLLKNNTSKNEVKVAVLDTGFLNELYDENNTLIYNDRVLFSEYNYSNSGDKNSSKDDNGHGSKMATIILDNTYENVKVLPIKILNEEGKGTISSLCKGLRAAIDNNVDIINLSISTASQNLDIVNELINEAVSKGIIIVGAAGNNSVNTKYVFPANNENIITIASINKNLDRSTFSNYGNEVDYCSIGEGLSVYNPVLDKMEESEGTSLSAAKATAIIAKIKGIDINYSSEDIKNILNENSLKIDKLKGAYCGNGILEEGTIYISEENNRDIEYTDQVDNKNIDISGIDNWQEFSEEEFRDLFIHSDEYKQALFWRNLSSEEKEIVKNKCPDILNGYTLQTYNFKDKEFKLIDTKEFKYYYEYLDFLIADRLEEITSSTYGANATYLITDLYSADFNDDGSYSNNYRWRTVAKSSLRESCHEEWVASAHYGHNFEWGAEHGSYQGTQFTAYTTAGWHPDKNCVWICTNVGIEKREGQYWHRYKGWHSGNDTSKISSWDTNFGDGWASVSYNRWLAYEGNLNWKTNAVIGVDFRGIQHKINFNANGGMNAPASIIKTAGHVRKLPTGTPTRLNYTFKGWATSSTSTTVAYTPGATYSADKDGGEVTLYAVWEPKTVTVYFDAMTSDVSSTRASDTYLIGQTATNSTSAPYVDLSLISEPNPSNMNQFGYTINSSNIKSERWGPSYDSGFGRWKLDGCILRGWVEGTGINRQGRPSNIEKQITATYKPYNNVWDFWLKERIGQTPVLYAVWTYDISFNANGGAFVGTNDLETSTIRRNYLDKTIAPGNELDDFNYRVERPGYKLVGWESSNGKFYYPGDKIDETGTLYAKWSKVSDTPYIIADSYSEITITFDKYKTDYNEAKSITIPSREPEVVTTEYSTTKKNYVFDGYYTSKSGGTQIIDAQGNIIVSPKFYNGNSTAYARWSTTSDSTKYYYITYDAGLHGSGTIEATKTTGEATITNKKFNPYPGWQNKSNYYWVDEEGNQYNSNQKITLTKNIKLTAQYEKAPLTAKINCYYLKVNGKESILSDYVLDNSKTITVNNLYIGDKINGLNYVNSSNEITGFKLYTGTNAPNYITTITTDTSRNVINLYFTRKIYSVTLDGDENVIRPELLAGAGNYQFGSEFTIDASAKNIINKDYSFNKWICDNPDFTTTDIKHTFTMPASNLVIKATTKKAEEVIHKVTLEPNGGTIIFNGIKYTDNSPNKVVELNEKSTVPISINKTGYIGGLLLIPSINTSILTPLEISNYSFTMGKEDLTIKATWQATSVKYTVNHWKQKVDGDVNKKDANNYDLYKTEYPLGIADSLVIPTSLGGIDIKGFTRITNEAVKIEPDGTTVIDIYYRRNIATFYYYPNGGTLRTTPKLYNGLYYKVINNQLYQCPTQDGTYVKATTTAIYKEEFFELINPYENGVDMIKTGYHIDPTFSYLVNGTSHSETGYTLSAKNKLKDNYYVSKLLENGDTNINLYAFWTADIYSITLDKCTGTGGTDEIYELYEDNKVNNPDAKNNVFYPTPECKEDEQITTVIPPTKDGYTFEGYYTQESGKGTQVIDKNGNIIVNNSFFTESTTVYAKWNYVISFDSNKPEIATYNPVGSMNQVTYTYDITGKLPANKYTITGWTFDSWNTKADGSGTSFKDMDNITNLGTRPLYAQWKQNECNIIYDLNDVSKNLDPEFGLYHPDKIKFDEDTEISNPTLSGYTFKGWTIIGYSPSTAKVNGTAHTSSIWNYEMGETFRNLNPNNGAIITFKANWQVNSYNVTLDTNKSSYQIKDEEMTHTPTIGITSYTMTTDSTANNKVNTSSVIGWKFTGWYDSAKNGTGEKVFDKDGNAVTGSYWSNDKEWIYPGNVTLYAHWEAITYTVNLYPNKHNLALRDYVCHNPSGWSWNNTDKYYSKVFTYDKVSNLPIISDTFTIEEWDGYGWYTSATDGVLKGIGTKKWNLTDVDKDIVSLYAQWKDNINPDFVDESTQPDNGGEDNGDNPDAPPKATLINGVYVWEWTNKQITLRAKATDIGSGIDRITIYETDSSFSEASRTHIKTDEGNGIESLTITYTVPEGERYYIAEAKDRWGNLSEIKYHTRYDKVAIRLDAATINQETLNNSTSASIEQDIKNGLHTTFTLSMNDTNSNIDINKNVSGLKTAILEVWDKQNPDIKLDYNFETLNVERTENASNNILKSDLSIAPNLYADFKDSAILTWKVIVTDYAGNESIIEAEKDIINYSSRTFIYNETADSNGNEVYNDNDDNTYFQVGEIGRVEVYTVGYTDNVSLDFNILGEESAIEISDGRMNEVYRLGTNTKDDMRILYSQHSEEIIPDYLRLHDDTNNITTYTDVTEEMLRNSDGNKYAQHYVFTIQIPPYYQLKENGTLRDDGSPLYDSEVHTYDAVVKKGTTTISPSNKLTLWDNISVSVHYRLTHES